MQQYLLRRIVLLLPTLFLALTAAFVLIRMIPGDAVTVLMDNSQYSKKDYTDLRQQLGIDGSIPVQSGTFMESIVRGDFGKSIWTGQPVMRELITSRLPITLELTFFATLIGMVIGVPAGVIAATKQDSPIDYAVRVVSIGALATPGFWIATLVLVLPSYWWHWAPPFGYKSFVQEPWTHIQQIMIPALIMSLALAAALMRMTRSMMLEVLRQDFIRTARAKGLQSRVVVVRHCLRNALLPVVSITGVQVAILLGGTVIYETIFSLPGVGSYLYEGVSRRDYPVVQGVTIMLTVGVILVNFVVDVSYRLLDPRVRY